MMSFATFAAFITSRRTPSEYGVTSEDFAFGPKTMSFSVGMAGSVPKTMPDYHSRHVRPLRGAAVPRAHRGAAVLRRHRHAAREVPGQFSGADGLLQNAAGR